MSNRNHKPQNLVIVCIVLVLIVAVAIFVIPKETVDAILGGSFSSQESASSSIASSSTSRESEPSSGVPEPVSSSSKTSLQVSSAVSSQPPKQEVKPSSSIASSALIEPKATDKIKISISNDSINGGEILVIKIENATEKTPITVSSEFDFEPQFFDIGGIKTALFPIHYNKKAGVYPLTITAGEESASYTINLADKKWQIQNLVVDETISNNTINNSTANTDWENAIMPLKNVSDKEKYWEGAFVAPCTGRISTEFGMIRYTNGSPTSDRHGGIDIATEKGTPVLAPNNGRILYADFLQLTGNTVLIEHGLGLKSYYYHMDSLNIKAGDMIKKGEKIGEVGTTGFSTGPHLHFAMSVNNVFVNPNTAYEGDLLK